MDGQEVYKFATRTLASDIQKLLGVHGLTPADVQWFVPHQANFRIIQMASSMLKVPIERFFMNIAHTGNTSCASVAIALDELARSGRIQEGDCVVLSAFGGGLTSAGALLRW
jgi:3-oxoacyl-[acyl-carrier-protein] synthase-3